MARILLSQAIVRNAKCPVLFSKHEITDLGCKGLVLEVRRTGGKTWYLRYTNDRGRQRSCRIGDAEFISLSQARKQSAALMAKFLSGEDPSQVRKERRLVPSFADFVSNQYLPYIKTYKRSWESDQSLLKVYLLPRFGKVYLDEISREDIVHMHHARRSTGGAPGSANRLLILMRFIFNLALRWETPGVKVNPAKGVPLFTVNNKKDRYLSAEEASRLHNAVCNSLNPMLRFIVPMLILTGARKREVLDARWLDFDTDRRIWRIPMTKAGVARHVPLSDGAMAVLSVTPRLNGCPWVFANPQTRRPYVTIFRAWEVARRRAGLPEVRLHDLRHSYASMLVNSGRTLYEVQRLLGHSQVQTTQRYAHLSSDTLLEASNVASKAFSALVENLQPLES